MKDDKRYRVDPELLDEHDEGMDADLVEEVEAIEADDGGAFHDPVLRRALLHAPDHAVSPMEETRESILSFAHEAVAPSLAAAPVWSQRSFVQRLLGMRGGAGFSAHIPWNGLVVIALVAAAVYVQDRDLMGDFGTKVARNEAAAPSSAAEMPAAVAPAMPSSETTAAAATKPAPAPAAPASVPVASVPVQPAAITAPAPVPVPVPAPAAPIVPATPTIAMPSVESPADAAARMALEQKLQRFEAAEAKARLAQRSDASGAPSSLLSSVLPRTAIPVEVPVASRAGRTGPAVQPDAGVPASQAPSRLEEPPTPTFSALSQWTRLTITSPAGETRRIARAEARELGPLVGSAALAGVGPQPLPGRVEWRIAFERNGEQLGLLEVAGSQIRWKEKGIPAGTGAPSASGLASLRQALKEAEAEPVKAPEPAPAAPAAEPAASPSPGAEPAQ